MKQFVKNLYAVRLSLLTVFLLLFSVNLVLANSKGNSKRTYKDIYSLLTCGGIENLKKGLESDNEGLRMACVDQVGMLKVTQLEDAIIELFDKEKSIVNRKNIAVTLYQLGTYKTLIKLEESAKDKDEKEMVEFCDWLVNEYSKVESHNWSNSLKIEEVWAVDIPSSLMYREEK